MPPALRRTNLLEDRTLRGRAFCEAYTDLVDEWLREVVADAGGGDDVALVAVGGQGRREMAPQSDLDLLLLTGPAGVPDGLAEKLWYPIWDAGLKLGHAVRSVRDTLGLAAEDLETATALLSARHLCGDPSLTAELAERARVNWRKKGRRWLEELARTVEDRHAAAGEVAFALEPDLKEGSGGLRDVHALSWASAAGADVDPLLVTRLMADHDVLLEVRVELHRAQSKPGDRLLLQEQDAVATRLGDVDADALMARVALAGRSIAFASDEAWHDIRASLNGTFFGRLRRDRRVDDELALQGARVCLVSDQPVTDPFAVLRVAQLAARQRLRISIPTLELLAAAPAPTEPWPVEARHFFCEFLLTGPAAVPVIETLDQWGIWCRLIPEWEPTRSRPQRNAYHRFTVDRHLMETAAEAAALAQRVPRPDLLVMGALFHDIGKGYPELGDHSVEGAAMVGRIAARMGFPDADVATIVALVRHHLLLPDVATRRDLDDPATIDFVAREVQTVERAALLRALTEADSIATGPSAWTPWRSQLVDQLAERTMGVLRGENLGQRLSGTFPTSEQRALLLADGVVVVAHDDLITVSCPDRPGVFFRVAGALALHGLDVVEANIHSESGRALDEFRVRTGTTGIVAWPRVKADVTKALEGRLALQARMEERARSHHRRHRAGIHQLAPRVDFDNGESAGSTVLEVVGPDSVGLLYRLARSLAEFNLNVSAARIQTIGHDVVDAFFVTGPDGGRVVDEELQAEVRLALLNALEVPS